MTKKVRIFQPDWSGKVRIFECRICVGTLQDAYSQIRRHPLDYHTGASTTTQVHQAFMNSCNSTATSPDNLTILHLRHLGPLGLHYLCRLNLSYRHAEIPAFWKQAIIIPLLKPGKPKNQGVSYHPISLLCPPSKVLERLIYTKSSPHINLADSQHGFRPGRSTTTALLPLVHQIAVGLNQHYPIHRTVSMALDFSKAFDNTTLLSDISGTTMDHSAIRWLTMYLRGRTTICQYNKTTSKSNSINTGAPQGSVLSLSFSTSMCHSSPTPLTTSPLHMQTTSLFLLGTSPPLELWRPWPSEQLGWSSGRLPGTCRSQLRNPL